MPTADKAAQAGPGQIFKWDKPSALRRAAARRLEYSFVKTHTRSFSVPSAPSTVSKPNTPTTPPAPSTPTGKKGDRRRCAAYPRLSSASECAMEQRAEDRVLPAHRGAVDDEARVQVLCDAGDAVSDARGRSTEGCAESTSQRSLSLVDSRLYHVSDLEMAIVPLHLRHTMRTARGGPDSAEGSAQCHEVSVSDVSFVLRSSVPSPNHQCP